MLERSTYGANALPGVVVGLALVFFAARYVEPALRHRRRADRGLRRALPAAGAGRARARRSAASTRSSRTPRAGSGAGSSATLRSVTLPLVSPGLLAGATLVFLSIMKELPATLLLRPIGFDTLATEVWTATGVSAYSRGGAARRWR